jgi:hypothetical protein
MKRTLGLLLVCSLLMGSMMLAGCQTGQHRTDRRRALTIGAVAAVVGTLAVLGGSTIDLQCERSGCDGVGVAAGKVLLLSLGIPTAIVGVGYLSEGIGRSDPAPAPVTPR